MTALQHSWCAPGTASLTGPPMAEVKPNGRGLVCPWLVIHHVTLPSKFHDSSSKFKLGPRSSEAPQSQARFVRSFLFSSIHSPLPLSPSQPFSPSILNDYLSLPIVNSHLEYTLLPKSNIPTPPEIFAPAFHPRPKSPYSTSLQALQKPLFDPLPLLTPSPFS